ncbi:MAG: hypothetical protein IJS81_11040, partial [Selenomonadaceae bacterium]|nr:hypothetical protein [Selenomonadaceae bacterium]
MNKEKFFPAATIFFCAIFAILFYLIVYAPLQDELSAAQMKTRRLQTISRDLENFKKRNGDIEKFSARIESGL